MTETDDELKTVAILALQTPVISATLEQWLRVAERLANRLQHPVVVVPTADSDDCNDVLRLTIDSYSKLGFRRFVLLPIGLEPFEVEALHDTIVWMHAECNSTSIYVSRSWTAKDWVDALYPGIVDVANKSFRALEHISSKQKVAVLLVSNGNDSGSDVGIELSSLAYHFEQSDENMNLRYAFLRNCKPSFSSLLRRLDSDGIHNIVLLPWRMNSTQIAELFSELGSLHAAELSLELGPAAWTWNRLSYEQPNAVFLLEHSGWLHVAVGMYLEALASRSIERYFEANEGSRVALDKEMRKGLIELDRRLDSMLPSEYQGRTDEVTPQSMGSAQIHSDDFGTIAWDEIWTSFCDLAMAGGPPHRGQLLEAISADQADGNLAAYNAVVQEIRRGIEMVTGLQTVEAKARGWVGVICNDEKMAVWLMRAIIVENVMVRREGAVLFLPAGPNFRVKKEIKNVITSVAKTVHYWRAHLRLL